ncbi:hypothetical protein BGY98DRAFT_239644 [Russula aff. rugulosa BPL654]|nr:hypothetical protein BGY98DRAFT_239644 [Russula aff. rugulosa BPL654]
MMSSITFALECPVCLDTLRNPVVPPCGHLICEPCIIRHISFSTNRFCARCPTCRALFPTGSKYHSIYPSLRRVFLGDMVDNNKAVINDLKSRIVCLEARIETLKSDNESAKRESCLMLDKAKEEARLALDEAKKEAQLDLDEVKNWARLARDIAKTRAQLALDSAKADLRLANLSLEEFRAENNALKSQVMKFRSVRNTVDSLPSTPLRRTLRLDVAIALSNPCLTTCNSFQPTSLSIISAWLTTCA